MGSQPAVKAIPRRTCVACRKVRAKKEIVRLVRTRKGNVEVDVSGKKDGRGAYICPNPECWEKALNGKQLEYALRCTLTRDNRQQLAKDERNLPKELTSAQSQ